MSSIIVVNKHYKNFPLVIAANRSDVYSYKLKDPAIIVDDPHPVFGLSEIDNGIWLGVNKHSLFASYTLQGEQLKNKLSPSLIVSEALNKTSLNEMISFIEELDPSKYNKFNLVFGNTENMFLAHSYILHSVVIREIPVGVNLITDNMVYDKKSHKKEFSHQSLDKIKDLDWREYYSELKKVLANSKYGIRSPIKKDDEGNKVGKCTHSSSILAFSSSGLERFKYYNRMIKKDKEDNTYRRYKDYIDVWRSKLGVETNSTNEEVDEPTTDDILEADDKIKIEEFKKLLHQSFSSRDY